MEIEIIDADDDDDDDELCARCRGMLSLPDSEAGAGFVVMLRMSVEDRLLGRMPDEEEVEYTEQEFCCRNCRDSYSESWVEDEDEGYSDSDENEDEEEGDEDEDEEDEEDDVELDLDSLFGRLVTASADDY